MYRTVPVKRYLIVNHSCLVHIAIDDCETKLQCSQAATQSEPNAKKPRLLRSCFRVDQQLSRSTHILPNICIICGKQKHNRDRCSGKRSYEHLVQCELIDGGQLLEAARLKEDHAILCQIENRDCVAIELKSCKLP